mgnify:CR=1 FL=1
MSQESPKHVLFVCTGNTCRSPMAERLLVQYLKQEKVDNITVSSAGVAAFAGDAMSHETAILLKEQGCDIEGFSSSRVVSQLLESSDVVVAMTRSHLSALKATFPEFQEKYYLLDSNWQNLKDANTSSGQDIADPIGCGMSAYESVAKDFKRIFPNLIYWLKNLN